MTGELDVFEALARRDAAAREAEIALVPGVGFDVVPTDCLAAHAASRVEDPARVYLALAGIGSGVTIDDRGLQGEAHRADLHFDLAGAGLGAHQVHDRAVHIHITTKEMHRLSALIDHAIALAVALIHGAEANGGQFCFCGIEQAAAVDVQKGQAAEQFTF